MEEEKKSFKSILGFGIAEVTFLGIFFLLFLGILNYFNVLSLSTLYPKQLGWLPHLASPSNRSYQTSITFPPLKDSSSTITLPLSTNNPTVRNVVISYEIVGIVQKVRNEGGKRFITLTQKNSVLEAMPIPEDVEILKIFSSEPKNPAKTTWESITPGKRLLFFLSYDVGRKSWKVLRINVQDITLAPSSSTKSQ